MRSKRSTTAKIVSLLIVGLLLWTSVASAWAQTSTSSSATNRSGQAAREGPDGKIWITTKRFEQCEACAAELKLQPDLRAQAKKAQKGERKERDKRKVAEGEAAALREARRADLALERKVSDERLREIERLRSQRWWLAGAGLTTGAAIVIGIWRLAGS